MTESIVKEAREAIDYAYEHDRDNREQMVEDLRFRAGFQWSDEAIQERRGRPKITINRTDQFVRQVANPIRENMPTIKVEPDHDDTSDMAEIANGLLRRIQYNSSAGHVYAQAVEHMVTCGIGWFRIKSDYVDEQSFDQELMIKRIFNPLSVYPDPAAREPDRSDMNYCVISEMMPRKTFEARWPKAVAAGLDTGQTLTRNTLSWNSGDTLRIGEYWRRKEVKKLIGLFANGQIEEIPDNLKARVGEMREAGLLINVREIISHKAVMSLVSGSEQLEDDYECPCRWIPIVAVVGAEVPLEEGVYRHGLIRFQREPQQLMNYYLSVTAEILGQQVKAPILATPAQIAKHKAMWDTANVKARPYLLYDNDPNNPGPPRRAPAVDLAAAFPQMAQIMSDMSKDATGIYDAGLGNRSNETSGIAIQARTEQGNQATLHFADNLEHSLEHAGRVMLDMIPHVYDNERTLRLVDDNEHEQNVIVNRTLLQFGGQDIKYNDLTKMHFSSVRVILGASYASRRSQTVDQLLRLIQAMPQVGAVAGDVIARNMDFDGSEKIAARLKAILPPGILEAEMAEQNGGMPPEMMGPDDAPMPPDGASPDGPPAPDPMQEMEMQAAMSITESQMRKAAAEASKEEARFEGVQLDNALKVRKLNEALPPRLDPGFAG